MIYPIDVYKTYIAIKLHFEKDKNFDYKVYNGNVKITNRGFERRNDFFYFLKISKKFNSLKEIEELFISNYIYNDSYNIIDLNSSEALSIYRKWKGKIDSFSKYFEEDMKIILSKEKKFSDMFFIPEKDYPKIIKYVLQKDIYLETLIIFYYMFPNKFKNFEKKYDDLIWNNFWKKFQRYAILMNRFDNKNWIELTKKCCKNATESV